MSVNKVILVGNLGQDPEINYTSNGMAVCKFSMATAETRKNKQSGEKETITEWHRISIFGDLAEISNTWLKKGSQIYIEGKLKTNKWNDKNGIERYTTEIIADTMRMLGNKKDAAEQSNKPATLQEKNIYEQKKEQAANLFSVEDIPF
jgi:single-strand DNA-binding protein